MPSQATSEATSPAPGDGAADPGELSAAEERGRLLYRQGESPSGGEVVAVLGEAGVEVPGSALPCASCHGLDGRGRPEGGVTPSNITWPSLTRPYTSVNGRRHPPYEPRDLVKAVSLGVDPAGNALEAAMPRYRMAHEDMADLVAYLQRLGGEPIPGVGPRTLVLGTLVPSGTRPGAALLGTLQEEIDALNADGGLYGRRLELRPVTTGATREETRAALAAALGTGPLVDRPFALVAPFAAGLEAELKELARTHEVPVIGPVSLEGEESFPVERYVFRLLPGEVEQARALLTHAVHLQRTAAPAPGASKAGAEAGAEVGAESAAGEGPRWAVLCPGGPEGAGDDATAALVSGLRREARGLGLAAPERWDYAPGAHDAAVWARRIETEGVEDLFLVADSGPAVRLLVEMGRLGVTPRIHLISGTAAQLFLALAAGLEPSVGSAALETFEGAVYLPLPLEPERGGSGGDELVQRVARAAVELLVRTLEAEGRDVTRESLVDRLETVYRVPTRTLPPVTWGPNRRLGVWGAHVVRFLPAEGTLEPAAPWVEAGRGRGGP